MTKWEVLSISECFVFYCPFS